MFLLTPSLPHPSPPLPTHSLTNCSSLVNALTSIMVYSGMSDTSVRQLRTAEVSSRAAMCHSTRSGTSVTDSSWSGGITSQPDSLSYLFIQLTICIHCGTSLCSLHESSSADFTSIRTVYLIVRNHEILQLVSMTTANHHYVVGGFERH